MKLLGLVLINIFIAQFSIAQQVYIGLPINGVELTYDDVILVEEIAWEGNYTNFSEIGLIQVKELNSFLNQLDSFSIEIGIHSFYGSNEKFNFKISESIVNELKKLLDKNLSNKVEFKCWGNTRPLSTSTEFSEIQRNQLNTRLEICLGKKK